MIDLLSLPRRNTVPGNQKLLRLISVKAGLPINSLPGWDQIPLNCKLPMLKCPGKQVIFSKNKIGQTFKSTKQEFDSSVRDRIPEYNPLHDPNLKTFYSNERNLKRLRENGEITEDNDVICTLKDFNEYRQELHKSHLIYVLQTYKQREKEQHDRMVINNAEIITKRDHQNQTARRYSHDEILARKKLLDEEKHRHFVQLAQLTENKFQRLESLSKTRKAKVEERKMLHAMDIQRHLDVCKDLQRKHLIKLKKLSQYEKDRFNRNMSLLRKQRLIKTNEDQLQSWNNRMDERIANQKRLQLLLTEVGKERKKFVENHKATYREKWAKLEEAIRARAREAKEQRKPKKHKLKKKVTKNFVNLFCENYKNTFESLLDKDLCRALNAAAIYEGPNSLTFAPDDSIYKVAQYILNYILKCPNRDLSKDECSMNVLKQRIQNFIGDAKKFVFNKAIQIINFVRENKGKEMVDAVSPQKSHSQARYSHVSFNGVANTIGVASYEIHPFVDVRPVCDRRATPAGSLTSLVVSHVEDQIIQDEIKIPHLKRDELIYIEHYLVKFKRELLIGMDKYTFDAIQCHFKHQTVDLREDLLKLDEKYLVEQIAKGILSYAVNPLNFQAVVKLAVSVLSRQVIALLHEDQLRHKEVPQGVCQLNCGLWQL